MSRPSPRSSDFARISVHLAIVELELELVIVLVLVGS